MKSRHQVSKAAIELIKQFEGYRRTSAALGDGRHTIGYGHTKTARAGVEIDERDAEALLIYDLLAVTGAVNDLTFTPLTQNQFDALVSFAFNIGVDNFRGSSVLRRINEGNLLQAAAALEMWRRSEFEGERIVVDALIRRRAAEKSLFLTPADGYVPAPSPVLPPRIDYELVVGASREDAHRLVTPLDGSTAEARSEGSEPVSPVRPDQPSPVTVAAEAFAARLREIEPEAPAEPTVQPEPSAQLPMVVTHEPAPDDVWVPDVMEAVIERPAAPRPPALILTPPEPEDAEFEPLVEPELEPQIQADPDAALLPFDAPDEEPPLNLAPPQSHAYAERREPTSYIAGDTFPRFEHINKPVRVSLLSMAGLFLGGLALVAFALVWGANTTEAGVTGPSTISWVIGLVGVACMVATFYLFVTRIGGSED